MPDHSEKTDASGSVSTLVRSLLKKRSRSVLARFAQVLDVSDQPPGDSEAFLETLEGRDEFVAVLRLVRWLEELSLSWVDLATLAEHVRTEEAFAFLAETGVIQAGSADLRSGFHKELLPALKSLYRRVGRERWDRLIEALAAAMPDVKDAEAPRLLSIAGEVLTVLHVGTEAADLLVRLLGALSRRSQEFLANLVEVLGDPRSPASQEGPRALVGAMLSTVELEPMRLRFLLQVIELLDSNAPAQVPPSLDKAVGLLRSEETRDFAAALLDLVATGPETLRKGIRQLIGVYSTIDRDQEFHVVPDIYGRNFHLLRDIRENAEFKEAADRVIGLGKSLLYYDRLYNLYESLGNVSRLYPDACLNAAEVGVYQGGTSFFLCDLLRKLHGGNARFYSIDTFEGHSAIDLPDGTEGLHSPKMFAKTSHEEVSRMLSEFAFATVIKSRIQECTDSIGPGPFHFVHLDVDIYDPMLFSLNLFLPRMAVGGIVCVDDYNKKSCPGVRQAVEQALANGEHSIIRHYTQTAQCLLVKVADLEG